MGECILTGQSGGGSDIPINYDLSSTFIYKNTTGFRFAASAEEPTFLYTPLLSEGQEFTAISDLTFTSFTTGDYYIFLAQGSTIPYAIICTITASTAAPENPSEGDLWINITSKVTSKYVSNEWVTFTDFILGSFTTDGSLISDVISTPFAYLGYKAITNTILGGIEYQNEKIFTSQDSIETEKLYAIEYEGTDIIPDYFTSSVISVGTPYTFDYNGVFCVSSSALATVTLTKDSNSVTRYTPMLLIAKGVTFSSSVAGTFCKFIGASLGY